MANAILKLKDGRAFDYVTNNVESDKAILFHHGTPGDCTAWSTWVAGIKDVKAIAASRPGYGLSDRRRGRTVAADIEDQSQLLDHFGIKQFVSIGWSGGGPHALNMTRNARNIGAITLAGVGEWGNKDLDFLNGMGPENHDEFGAALAGEKSIEEWMKKNSPGLKTVTGSQLISAMGGLIGKADKDALTPEVADEEANVFRRALSVSYYGWLDDELAFVQSFGFELNKIDKPVLIWQGDDDFMVPREHSNWLAKHIPGSKLNFVPGHGHISLVQSYKSEIITQALKLLNC